MKERVLHISVVTRQFFFVNSTMSFSHFPTRSFSKMAHYLNDECADLVYCHGLAEGNGNAAGQMYCEKYPNRRHPSPKVIRNMFIRLKELACFYTTASQQPLRTLKTEERILELIQENPRISVREIAGKPVFLLQWCEES